MRALLACRAPVTATAWSSASSSTRLQFGPGEDLARYPRTLDADLALCAADGVDLVWAPAVGRRVSGRRRRRSRVAPGPLGAELEGAARPGHFAGVLTVVAKMLRTGPARAVACFGEKDYQQLDADPADGRRPRARRRTSSACHRARAGRAGAVEPQRLPVGRGAGARRSALSPRAARRARRGAGGADAVAAAARRVLAAEPAVVVDYLELRGPTSAEVA